MLKRLCLLLAILFAPGAAFGQGAVLQQGGVFKGHAAQWLSNGYIADAGGPQANGSAPVNPLTELLPLGYASVNSGLGTCQFSGYGAAAYSQLCTGFDGNGNGLLTLDTIGGLTPPVLTFASMAPSIHFPSRFRLPGHRSSTRLVP